MKKFSDTTPTKPVKRLQDPDSSYCAGVFEEEKENGELRKAKTRIQELELLLAECDKCLSYYGNIEPDSPIHRDIREALIGEFNG